MTGGREGINTERAKGRAVGALAGNVGSGSNRIWRVTAGRRERTGVKGGGGGDQSVLYSHSLNPLWNRSMKCHSPVQKEVRRKVMREDRAEVISAPTCDEVRVMVIFIHTVQHENIISITEHRDVV